MEHTADRQLIRNENDNRFSRQVLRYSLLFILTAVCTYAMFIVLPRTFLSNAEGNIDGIAQQYPIYSEIKRLIHGVLTGHGWNSWSWDIGLGDDAFVEFNTKLLNPLTYIVIAFPQRHLDIGFTLMVIVSQYLSGLAFMLMGRNAGLDRLQNVTGGLCYAFSGWIIQAILRQGTFLTATILLPILILGIDRMINGGSPLILIISIAAHIVYSIQWAYVGAIAGTLYLAVRLVVTTDMSAKGRIRIAGEYIACGIAGVMLSGVVLVGSLAKMIDTTTTSSVDRILLYPLSQYLEIPTGFFLTTSTTEAYTVLGMSAVCVIILPIAASRIRAGSPQAIMMIVLFILSLIPATGSVFNGFSYSVGRWYYVLDLFMVWSCMDCYSGETFQNKRNARIMMIWISCLALWGVVVCYGVLDIINLTKALTIVIGTVFGIAMISLLTKHGACSGHPYDTAMTILIILSIAGYVNPNLAPGLGEQIHTLCQVGRIERDFSSSTQRVVPELQEEDTGFFRTDQVDGYTDARIARVRANENMYFGNRAIYTYLSTMDSDWHEFNRVLGNNAGYFDRTTSYSNDNREGMDLLLGVKYFLGDSEGKRPGADEYAGYGFEQYKRIEGVNVLKNRYDLGLGTVLDQYVTYSELMEYSPLEREQVMLQAAVIPDDQAYKAQSLLKHASGDDILTDIREEAVTVSAGSNVEMNADPDAASGSMAVYGKGGTISIDLPEIKSSRVMLAFEGLTRETSDFDTDMELRGKTFDGNIISRLVKKVSYVDDEKFKIEATKGNIVKAAQMRKGKNQGYSDITDFYINLGYFDTISGEVTIDIDRAGIYHYDRISVYSVPMDIYEETAGILTDHRFRVDEYQNDRISGTVSAGSESILYLSILDQGGWMVYVDGQRLGEDDIIHDLDIAFLGIRIPEGDHNVEMRYRTPFITEGIVMSICGCLMVFFITARYRRNKADTR